MKKNLMFVSAMAAALLLGACTGGGGGGETTSSYNPIPYTTHEPYTPSGETVTLTVWAGEKEESQQYMQVVGNEFSYYWHEKFPDAPEVIVEVSAVSEANAKDELLKDATVAADFAICADDQIAELITAQVIQPLTTSIREFDPQDIIDRNSESSIALCTYDETLYAFPVSASNGYFLYYDARKLTEEDCATFDSLLAAIDRVSTADGVNYRFGHPTGSGWYIDGWWRGAGFSVTRKADGTNSDCDWNRTTPAPSGVDVAGAMLKYTHGQYGDHWIGAGDGELVSLITDGTTGQVIATINGTWNSTTFQDAWTVEGAAATALPKYKVGDTEYQMQSVAGCKVGVVNAVKSNSQIAAHFGDFLTNADNQVYRYNTCAEAPTNTEATGRVDLNANYAVAGLAKQLSRGGFVQQVGSGYWTPAGSLAASLYSGTSGETSLITSGDYTADVVINETALQDLLDTAVATISGTVV